MAIIDCSNFSRTEAAHLVGATVRQKRDGSLGYVSRMTLMQNTGKALFSVAVNFFEKEQPEVHGLNKSAFDERFQVIPSAPSDSVNTYSWLKKNLQRFPGSVTGDIPRHSGKITLSASMSAVDIGLLVLSVFELTGGYPVTVVPPGETEFTDL